MSRCPRPTGVIFEVYAEPCIHGETIQVDADVLGIRDVQINSCRFVDDGHEIDPDEVKELTGADLDAKALEAYEDAYPEQDGDEP